MAELAEVISKEAGLLKAVENIWETKYLQDAKNAIWKDLGMTPPSVKAVPNPSPWRYAILVPPPKAEVGSLGVTQ